MSADSAEKDAGRVDALWIESGGVLTLATCRDGQIEARTSGGRVVLDAEAVTRLLTWLAEHSEAAACTCPPVSLHAVGCPVVTSPNACPACGVELDPTGFCGWCDWGPEGDSTRITPPDVPRARDA